ncbi:NIPSNAP family protein [Paenibacillus sedimenti]
MLYELRIYHIHPGKMQEIQARFRDRTLQIFAKHGALRNFIMIRNG